MSFTQKKYLALYNNSGLYPIGSGAHSLNIGRQWAFINVLEQNS